MSKTMLAKCKSSLGEAIPPSKRYLGEVDETDYAPLTIGENYLVYALLFVFDRVDFLLRAPDQPPFWVPSNLFDLIDSEVPSGWEFCITQSSADYKVLFDVFGIHSILGYSLLVNEYQHYVGVVEREPREVLKFMISLGYCQA
ncbi:hypothetical protein [Pseudomonas gregormendelii]